VSNIKITVNPVYFFNYQTADPVYFFNFMVILAKESKKRAET